MVLIPAQILYEMRGFCCWKWSCYHEDIEHSLWQLQMYGNSHLCSGGGISQFLQWIFAFSERNDQRFHPGAITQVPMQRWVFTQVLTEGKMQEQLEFQMKHRYQATHGNRMLHSFLFKEKSIFEIIALLKERVHRVLCISHSLKVINVYYCKCLSICL